MPFLPCPAAELSRVRARRSRSEEGDGGAATGVGRWNDPPRQRELQLGVDGRETLDETDRSIISKARGWPCLETKEAVGENRSPWSKIDHGLARPSPAGQTSLVTPRQEAIEAA